MRLRASKSFVDLFAKYRTCVFVHGCFWHRHPDCRRASMPGARRIIWEAKFRQNVERDLDATKRLRALGWRVEVIWACETQRLDRLHAAIRCRELDLWRAPWPASPALPTTFLGCYDSSRDVHKNLRCSLTEPSDSRGRIASWA
ncbi:MAG: hypothetical protein ACT4QB_06420 [Gammaproteobacteria bacterium]